MLPHDRPVTPDDLIAFLQFMKGSLDRAGVSPVAQRDWAEFNLPSILEVHKVHIDLDLWLLMVLADCAGRVPGMSTSSRDWVAAVHEAAHAVITYRRQKIAVSASIVPTTATLGDSPEALLDALNPDHVGSYILSCYAGGHAQRRADPAAGNDGCQSDDDTARELLRAVGWEERENAFRDQALFRVGKHWAEIVAVAAGLVQYQTLDAEEVKLFAEAALGDEDADQSLEDEDYR